jgi:predicted hydrocarbon binding protein
MDRKQFLRASCGLCGCMGAGLLAAPNAAGETEQKQLGAMFSRFAWFIEAVGQTLDPATQARLLESVGRRCAQEYAGPLIAKHRGNLEALLAEAQTIWMERAEYDRERGILRVIDKKRAACACPLVKQPPFSGDTLCQCSRGFQKELYGQVAGRPVEVTVDRSLLRGDDHCEFTVRFKTPSR